MSSSPANSSSTASAAPPPPDRPRSGLINWSRVSQVVGTILLGAVMILLLQPGTGRRRFPKASPHCADHLRQIGKALATYVSVYRQYPPRYTINDRQEPLLSWRVLLLPYLGEQELYDRFHRQEPWDSPHNLRLLASMPQCFRCPLQDRIPSGHTTYLAAYGPGCVFNDSDSTGDELLDHLNTTLLIGEVSDRHAPWSQPVDIPIFEHLHPGDHDGFSSRHADGAHYLFADGHVSFLIRTFPTELIRAMATHDGGEEVPAPEDWHLFNP